MKKYFRYCSLSITDHAEVRTNQRGFKNADLEILADYSDQIIEAGGGSVTVALSRKGLNELDPDQRALAEKTINKALVVKDGVVVTAVCFDNSKDEKRMRKGMNKDGHPHRPRQRRKQKNQGYLAYEKK